MRFLVIQDFKENPRKCTAIALDRFAEVELVRLARPEPRELPREVPGGIWLAVDAPDLTRADRGRLGPNERVIVLDASWARVAPLARRLRTVPGGVPARRSLPCGLRTAYPRVSKARRDPHRGLATVEAIFATTVILGDPRPEWLESYRWGREFVDLNRPVWESLGWPG